MKKHMSRSHGSKRSVRRSGTRRMTKRSAKKGVMGTIREAIGV
jgi:hypothetical protein